MELFNEFLAHMPTGWRDATVDVCDTAETAKLWFEGKGIDYTAADVVALAALIVERETELLARDTGGPI